MERALDAAQIAHFIEKGFVKVENAFSKDTAAAARDMLWQHTGVDRNNPATWTKPVIWLGMFGQPPFVESANTPVLLRAFDQLVGAGKWYPRNNMGTFPIRFPSEEDSGDTGWHVDASFPGADPGNFFEWRVNVNTRGRGLLMLFLYSDVSEHDAPTRIRMGSHLDVARLLRPKGDDGLAFMELAAELDGLPNRDEALATGEAGTVYLCHPFLVHAAQRHTGSMPKFMAQPPLVLKDQLSVAGNSPVEQAIRLGMNS